MVIFQFAMWNYQRVHVRNMMDVMPWQDDKIRRFFWMFSLALQNCVCRYGCLKIPWRLEQFFKLFSGGENLPMSPLGAFYGVSNDAADKFSSSPGPMSRRSLRIGRCLDRAWEFWKLFHAHNPRLLHVSAFIFLRDSRKWNSHQSSRTQNNECWRAHVKLSVPLLWMAPGTRHPWYHFRLGTCQYDAFSNVSGEQFPPNSPKSCRSFEVPRWMEHIETQESGSQIRMVDGACDLAILQAAWNNFLMALHLTGQ